MALDVRYTPQVERWRPLLLWLITIPLNIVASVYGIAAGVLVFIGWFAALFTTRLPESFGDFLSGYLRFLWRVRAYLFALTTRHPDFGLPIGRPDPGGDAAVLFIGPPTRLSRVTVFFRLLMAIPHLIVLYVLQIVASVVFLIAWFVVLFSGRWPELLREFAVSYFRWEARLFAYLFLLVEEFPPFKLD